MPSKDIIYYRPYLTAENLDAMCVFFKSFAPDDLLSSPQVLDTYKKIYELKVKKDNKTAFAVYKTKGTQKEQLRAGLGFDPEPVNNGSYDTLTFPQKRGLAYKKYLTNLVSCSKDEIDMALTYMFENGLMSREESNVYTNKLLGLPDFDKDNDERDINPYEKE